MSRLPRRVRTTLARNALGMLATAALSACAGLPTDFSDSDGRLPPSQRQHPAEHLRELPTALVEPVALQDGRIAVSIPVDPGLILHRSDSPRATRATLAVRDEYILLDARETWARVDTTLVADTTALMQPIADAVGAFRVEEPAIPCGDAVLFVPTGPVATDDGLLLGTLFVTHDDGTILTLQALAGGIDEADLRSTTDLALGILASASCGGEALSFDGGARILEGPGGAAISLTLPAGVALTSSPAGDGTMHWLDVVGTLLDEPASLIVYLGPDALTSPAVPTGPIAPLPADHLDGAWVRTPGTVDAPARDDLYATLADGTPVHATASAWDPAVLDGLRQIFDGAVDLRR